MNRLLLLLMVFLCGCSRGASSSVFQLSGTVESVQVDIASQIPGQVLFLPEEGAAVKQGDVLVRIDAREYADRVKQAEAALVVAREAIRQSELNAAYRAAATDAAQRTASATVSGSESRVNEAEYARDQEAQAADAAVSEALARVSSAEHAVRQAEARLRETRVRAEHAERDRLRNEQLLGQGYIPPQRADTSRTEARAARQRVDEAVAAVGQARAQLAQARGGLAQAESLRSAVRAREAQVATAESNVAEAQAQLQAARSEEFQVAATRQQVLSARARVKEAQAALDVARTQLAHATVKAPLSGMISEKIVQAGEQITPGQPLLRVSRLSRVWVDVYIPEPRLPRVWLGMPARIAADGAPGTIDGVITFLSPEAEFTPKNVQTQEERTTLVYRAKVSADNPQQVLKPGMPVDVVLDLSLTPPAGVTPGRPGNLKK